MLSFLTHTELASRPRLVRPRPLPVFQYRYVRTYVRTRRTRHVTCCCWRGCGLNGEKTRKLKPRKFLLDGWMADPRNFAPAKISRYTVYVQCHSSRWKKPTWYTTVLIRTWGLCSPSSPNSHRWSSCLRVIGCTCFLLICLPIPIKRFISQSNMEQKPWSAGSKRTWYRHVHDYEDSAANHTLFGRGIGGISISISLTHL